jgi:hypothetical protein
LAGVVILSLGLISILMPARMLAADIHSTMMAHTHAMTPCDPTQPCGGCEHGNQNTGCESGGLCIASCSPILMRLPHEILLRTRVVTSILLPSDESIAVSLYPDPPKRPPRIA